MADEKLEVLITADDQASSVLQKLGGVAGGILKVGFGVALAGATALAGGLALAVNEAMGFQDVQAQMAAVLKSTKNAVGLTQYELTKMGTALSLVTKYGEEEVMNGENLLLTFTNIGKNVFPEATQTMLDMSTALGTDLKSSAIQLGKALQDPIKGVGALARVGVNFTEAQKDMIKKLVESGKLEEAQALILKELQTEFGGSAEAAGKTFGGQLTILKNRLMEAAEAIGLALLPFLEQFMQGMQPVITIIEVFATALGELIQTGDFGVFLDNIREGLYDLFPKEVIDRIITFVIKINQVGLQIKAFVEGTLVPIVQQIAGAIYDFVTNVVIPFVEEHSEAFKNALIAIGVVLAGAGIVAGIIAIVGALGALLNPVTLIIAAVGLLAAAWTEDWGGIRTTITEWWTTTGQPIFNQLVAWLQVNIPIAIQTLTNFWNTVLLPAIQAVWTWMSTVLIPFLTTVVFPWLQENIPKALQTLANFWTTVLKPAIETVWNWIVTVLIPLFQQVWDWLATNIPAAINTAKSFWENTLLPAITNVWNFINTNLVPIFNTIVDIVQNVWKIAIEAARGFWENVLLPAITKVWDFIDKYLKPIFDTIVKTLKEDVNPKVDALRAIFETLGRVLKGAVKEALDWLYQRLQDIKEFLGNFKLPPWLTPGSPTPFEIGLWGIVDALKAVADVKPPAWFSGKGFIGPPIPMPGISLPPGYGGISPVFGGMGQPVPRYGTNTTPTGPAPIVNNWYLNYQGMKSEGDVFWDVTMLIALAGGM